MKIIEAESQKLEDGACTGRGVTFYSSVVVVRKRIFGKLFQNNMIQRMAAHHAAQQSGVFPAPPISAGLAARIQAIDAKINLQRAVKEGHVARANPSPEQMEKIRCIKSKWGC